MSAQGHRFFDHTGDFGADLWAPTAAGVFEEAALAFVELLTDAPGAVHDREARRVELEGVDHEDLMVALGNELLFWFATEAWLPARLAVEALDDDRLTAVAHGEAFDPERHPIARPIKAVTHHGASLRRAPDGSCYEARLIFDL